jgi:hypothetical protein
MWVSPWENDSSKSKKRVSSTRYANFVKRGKTGQREGKVKNAYRVDDTPLLVPNGLAWAARDELSSLAVPQGDPQVLQGAPEVFPKPLKFSQEFPKAPNTFQRCPYPRCRRRLFLQNVHEGSAFKALSWGIAFPGDGIS